MVEPRFELIDDRVADRGQRRPLVAGERTCPTIEDGERAYRVPVRRAQRNAGVETDRLLAGDERVAGEARIGCDVADLQYPVVRDRVRAERDGSRKFAQADPVRRLDPLAVAVDQRNQRDRSVADARGQTRERVEQILARRVEKLVFIEGGKAPLFSTRDPRWRGHRRGVLASLWRRPALPPAAER